MKNFAERLRLLQGNRSQKEFAEWLAESQSRLSNYMAGRGEPAYDFLRGLALRGVNLNWFIVEKGPMYVDYESAESLPEPVQTLIHEVMGVPGLAEDLTEIVRSKRRLQESLEVLQNTLKNKKKSS